MSTDALQEGKPPSARVPEPLSRYAVEYEQHLNAPGVVVRADETAEALATAREELGYDHCACVTAQGYGDRYE